MITIVFKNIKMNFSLADEAILGAIVQDRLISFFNKLQQKACCYLKDTTSIMLEAKLTGSW